MPDLLFVESKVQDKEGEKLNESMFSYPQVKA